VRPRTAARATGCDDRLVLREAAMLARLAIVFVTATIVLGPAVFA
jgi:hypothetical protein